MIDEIEQIVSLLKRVSVINPFSVAKHISLATRQKDIFHLSNKQFLEILEKYELEINFDDTVENPEPSFCQGTAQIIEEGMDINKMREDIFYNEEQ